jgi:FK506-binding protein 2
MRFVLSIVAGVLAATATLVSAAADPNVAIRVLKMPKTCTQRAKNGDHIAVHYNGTLKSNGKLFDSSYPRGAPFDMNLGRGEVIKG